jgi:hypothetical protein
MSEATRIEDANLHADYRAAEERYRSAAARLVERELDLQAQVRSLTEADEEERQAHYIEGHGLIEAEYARLTSEFGRQQGKAVAEARRKLFKGAGPQHFSEMLARASGTPDEGLPELAKLAAQTGDASFEQAVALVADQRKPHGTSPIFQDWVARDPARQAAYERLKGTPKAEQFHARTLGVKPPKARPADLQPTADDEQRAIEEKAARAAPRVEFFGGTAPRRQVGSRIS